MRFLMRNCVKYAQQYQNGIFKKTCQATMVPHQLCESPVNILYTLEVWGNPVISDAEIHSLWPFYLLNLKIVM